MRKLLGLVHGASVEDALAAGETALRASACRAWTVSEVLERLQGTLVADLVVEGWWDDADIDEGRASVVAAGALRGASGATWWLTREHVYKRRSFPPPAGRLKVVGSAYKRDDFTTRAFFDYWRDIHGPISGAAPGLGAYVVSEVLARIAGEDDADGFVEQWWPDRPTFAAASDSPQVAVAWEDVAKYAKPTGTFWLTREHVLAEPPADPLGTLER